jgi:hypothetical protein
MKTVTITEHKTNVLVRRWWCHEEWKLLRKKMDGHQAYNPPAMMCWYSVTGLPSSRFGPASNKGLFRVKRGILGGRFSIPSFNSLSRNLLKIYGTLVLVWDMLIIVPRKTVRIMYKKGADMVME